MLTCRVYAGWIASPETWVCDSNGTILVVKGILSAVASPSGQYPTGVKELKHHLETTLSAAEQPKLSVVSSM